MVKFHNVYICQQTESEVQMVSQKDFNAKINLLTGSGNFSSLL